MSASDTWLLDGAVAYRALWLAIRQLAFLHGEDRLGATLLPLNLPGEKLRARSIEGLLNWCLGAGNRTLREPLGKGGQVFLWFGFPSFKR